MNIQFTLGVPSLISSPSIHPDPTPHFKDQVG